MSTNPASPSDVIVTELLDAPAARVWQAITDPACFKDWYFELPGFRAEVGYEFEFMGGEEGRMFRHLSRVTSVIQEKELAYSWRYDGYEGDSLVTFSLAAEGDKTRVTLTHNGLETFPPIKDFARENFLMGWTDIIGRGLKEFVEKR